MEFTLQANLQTGIFREEYGVLGCSETAKYFGKIYSLSLQGQRVGQALSEISAYICWYLAWLYSLLPEVRGDI
jgi:hypothetical protein